MCQLASLIVYGIYLIKVNLRYLWRRNTQGMKVGYEIMSRPPTSRELNLVGRFENKPSYGNDTNVSSS